MNKIFLIIMIGNMSLSAKSNTEKLGDFLTFAIPATAYASTFYMDDEEGKEQFYWAYGTTMFSTIALKYTVRAKRPDNDDRDSFPSGHTSSAVSGAVFIHKRYGLKYAIPAYLGAAYTGYSRIHVNRHHPRDVIAGAVIGAVSSWYFVDSFQKLRITPEVGSDYKGIQLNYKF
ncbi:MAG: phosphatase PAP2 family protein [Sulfurovum sp.]|nr:phosphatase PAP2 family protein [Sulfurovum sp.]